LDVSHAFDALDGLPNRPGECRIVTGRKQQREVNFASGRRCDVSHRFAREHVSASARMANLGQRFTDATL
jgi:hypothetical protein